MTAADPVLDLPYDVHPDPEEFYPAAMRWHFSPETGSRFWLDRLPDLGFDPLTEIRSVDDLRRFPNLVDELRDTRVEDLIPRGYGDRPDVVGVYESGGTTGAPKRVVLLREWLDLLLARSSADLDAHGVPQGVNWLLAVPSGPHMIGDIMAEKAKLRGGLPFRIDLDPRWVKACIGNGKGAEAAAYSGHIVEQIAHHLRTQDVGVLVATPPALEKITQDDDLVKLVNEKVRTIYWLGTHMDPDTRELYRGTIFPGATLYSGLGSTMILSNAGMRLGLTDDDPCVYDSFSPYTAFHVVDPEDPDRLVEYGERGQLVMHHVSRSALLPNNLERDTGLRIAAPEGHVGDSIGDVGPVEQFDDTAVVEGVY